MRSMSFRNLSCPWKGLSLRTFSGCIYEMSPVLASQFSDLLRGGAVLFRLKRFLRTKRSTQSIWYDLKRFLGTKHCKKFILFRLKRFRGTKLYEDCRLWPAAHEVERIAPAWRTSPHGPTGRRTWNPSFPYHMSDVYGFPRHGQTHETP